jgi:hypothetical protein
MFFAFQSPASMLISVIILALISLLVATEPDN